MNIVENPQTDFQKVPFAITNYDLAKRAVEAAQKNAIAEAREVAIVMKKAVIEKLPSEILAIFQQSTAAIPHKNNESYKTKLDELFEHAVDVHTGCFIHSEIFLESRTVPYDTNTLLEKLYAMSIPKLHWGARFRDKVYIVFIKIGDIPEQETDFS